MQHEHLLELLVLCSLGVQLRFSQSEFDEQKLPIVIRMFRVESEASYFVEQRFLSPGIQALS